MQRRNNSSASFLRSSISAAALVTITLCLCAAIGYAISTSYFPFTKDRVNLRVGATVFSMRCQSCHSLASSGKPKMGPALAKIGAVAATRKSGLSAQEYILESVLQPDAYIAPDSSGQMPSGLVDDIPDYGVRALVAYLLQRGGDVEPQDILTMQISRPVETGLPRLPTPLGAARRGQVLFNTTLGCAACHGFFGERGEGLLAPSLAQSGLLGEDYILESLRDPSAVIAPGYQQINVTIKDGSVVSGRVWTETDSHLSLLSLDSEGLWQVQKLSRNDISDVQKIPTSIMPPYQLPRLQRYDLMAFLMSMKSVGGVH